MDDGDCVVILMGLELADTADGHSLGTAAVEAETGKWFLGVFGDGAGRVLEGA